MSQMRVGEACNPGPSTWSLSVINPSGISNKAQLLPELGLDVIAVSETHLTKIGQQKFQRELRSINPQLRLSPGGAVANRSTSRFSTGGKQSGVAVITSHPSRPVGGQWSSEMWSSARVHASHVMVDNQWITGGVVYGYSYQSWKSSVRDETNALLQHVADKVLPFPGPKYICGDWNMEPDRCEFLQCMRALGWQDLQDVMMMKWGITPVVTCKGATRKDYMLLCPLLQERLQFAQVRDDIFAEHAALIATFGCTGSVPMEPSWHKPRKISFPKEHEASWKEFYMHGKTASCPISEQSPCQMTAGANACSLDEWQSSDQVTCQYQQIWQDYETATDGWLRDQGLPALVAKQRGRACTRAIQMRPAQPIVIKPSRQGECQLVESCPTRLIKSVFLQVRRLDNLHRVCLAHEKTPSPARHQHACSVWRAIRQASGFGMHFAQWWCFKPLYDADTPPVLPTDLPALTVIQSIRQHMEHTLRHLEKDQLRRCQELNKKRHQTDIHAIFKDVKEVGPMPVETLLTRVSATVVEVPDADTVIFDDLVNFDDNLPVYGDAAPLRIEVCMQQQLWFQQEHTLQVGQTIYQTHPVGNVDQMFDMFIQAWSSRWDKHRDIPAEQWNTIIQFLEVAMPTRPMQMQPLTVDIWAGEVKRKPKKAAGGMDGVDRADLGHLPYPQQQQLVQLLQHVEKTGTWPEQLLHGAIFSLQKTPQAESVDGYRPITILPLVYRTWSSLRGRELLQHLQEFLPGTLCGSANRQSAMTVWYAIQAQIEQSFLDGTGLCGAITDITKAFNCLPRVPLVGAAVITGVDAGIIRPWMGMLTSLERHFSIRHQISRGVTAATGFAEGCCLSVGAMLLANLALHAYMTVASPQVRLWSYIDNWELTCPNPHLLQQGLEKIREFASVLDLTMDDKKAMVWAVTPEHRQMLRQHSTPVVRSTRDLGGHMQFTKQLTSRTLLDKCTALAPMWNKLGRSFAPRFVKHKVLRMKAWPSALHASPGVHVSDAVLKQLRSAAMQSLRLTKAGSNAGVYLGLALHPMHDPECYILLNCVKNVRKWIPQSHFSAYAGDVAFTPDRQRVPGPIGVLFDRLEHISWTWVCDTWWRDHEQRLVNLYTTCVQEVVARVIASFQAAVGRKVSHRHGFAGMHRVDPCTTTTSMKKLGAEEVALIRALHMGAFITADQTGPSNRIPRDQWLCKFCGAPDSLDHRHWACSATAHLRKSLTPFFTAWLHAQPQCTRQRGWATFPDAVSAYQDSLVSIQDTTHVFLKEGQPRTDYTFFTDGTAKSPTDRWCRLAAWAWCFAFPGDWDFQVGAQGGVPGGWQTVGRAELQAVVSVLQFCVRFQCGGMIVCDSQYVTDRFRDMLLGKFQYDALTNDDDLWAVVDALLHEVRERISIIHIYSHQDSAEVCEAERWTCRGNDFADYYAQEALNGLPPKVLELQQLAQDAVKKQKQYHTMLITYMAQVGQFSLQFGQTTSSTQDDPGEEETRVEALAVQNIVNTLAGGVPVNFQQSGLDEWVSWFLSIVDEEAPVRWVSWLELLIHYQATTEKLGVKCLSDTSGNHRLWLPVTDETTTTWPALISSFSRFGTALIRLHDSIWKACQRKPTMWRIKFWLSCIPVRMAMGAVRCIEEFFDS